VTEQVGVVVTDAALDVVQVGVADPAGLDLDHRLPRSGIGHVDPHQLDRRILGTRDDSLDLLRHVVLLVPPGTFVARRVLCIVVSPVASGAASDDDIDWILALLTK
jgi:hypothetical protein